MLQCVDVADVTQREVAGAESDVCFPVVERETQRILACRQLPQVKLCVQRDNVAGSDTQIELGAALQRGDVDQVQRDGIVHGRLRVFAAQQQVHAQSAVHHCDVRFRQRKALVESKAYGGIRASESWHGVTFQCETTFVIDDFTEDALQPGCMFQYRRAIPCPVE